MQRLGLIEFKGKFDEVSRQLARISMSDITQEQKNKELDRLKIKMSELREFIQDKFGVSESGRKSESSFVIE